MHEPVLLKEVIDGLNISAAGFYVDCTFGAGGHTRAILERLGPQGRILAADRDLQAISAGAELVGDTRVELVHERFSRLEHLVRERGMWGQINGVLLDLGVSSPQLREPSRGFSFSVDGPLDMRMDAASGISAADWLGAATEHEIADCLWRYGEERNSRRIAKRIVESRRDKAIDTTRGLAEIVTRAMPFRRGRIDPATRTFQAIRIQVNEELDELSAVLPQACGSLACGGRVAVIAFHSLEDRLAKRFFRDLRRTAAADAGGPQYAAVTRKPVRPSLDEVETNPRARSARLRVLERCA